MSDKTKVYYLASVLCKQTKAYDGTILTHENDKIWLGYSEGYAQCGSKGSAHKFKTSEEISIRVKHWDGMPWTSRLKEGTLEIIKVTDRTLHEIKEEIVK